MWLRHSVRALWNKKEWFAVAGGREYALRSFMTYCVRMQTRARGLCSHELPLYLTIQRNKDGSWRGFLGITAPQCSASVGPAWITNSCLISGSSLISPNAGALLFSETHTYTYSTPILFGNGKGSAFTDGAQITTEDKAIVRTGGLVFTSSPTASITESFHHHPTAFFFYLWEKVAWLLGVLNCSDSQTATVED